MRPVPRERARPRATRGLWAGLIAALLVVAACDSSSTGVTEGPTTTGAATSTTEPPVEEFVYRIGLWGEPATTNPWRAIARPDDWTPYVLPASASLYTYLPPTYSMVPMVAAPEEPPLPEPDGEVFTVTVPLRDYVTWSDGTPLTAHDVAFTFDVVRKLGGLDGKLAVLWPIPRPDDPSTATDETVSEGVVDVVALDDTTVEISFNFDPGVSVWPYAVGMAPIFQEAYWESLVESSTTVSDLYAHEALDHPTAGPFRGEEHEPGSHWSNQAVEDYWNRGARYVVYPNGAVAHTTPAGDRESYGGEPVGEPLADYEVGPYANEVRYSFYPDPEAGARALAAGEVDILLSPQGIPITLQEILEEDSELEVVVNRQNELRYLAFNLRKFPMSDKAFRQAVACRIDKEFMAEEVLGSGVEASDLLVPPGIPQWSGGGFEGTCDHLGPEERLNRSVQILKEAGWTWETEPAWNAEQMGVTPQGEGLRGPGGEEIPPLVLLTPLQELDPLRMTYGLHVEQWAEELGIPLDAQPTDFDVLIDTVFFPGVGGSSLDWDMYILGWDLTPFPDQVFDFFVTSQDAATGSGLNTTGYSNPELDAVAEEFDDVQSQARAKELVNQAELTVLDDLPYVMLYTSPLLEAYRTSLEFPFVSTLDGLQEWGGLPALVQRSG